MKNIYLFTLFLVLAFVSFPADVFAGNTYTFQLENTQGQALEGKIYAHPCSSLDCTSKHQTLPTIKTQTNSNGLGTIITHGTTEEISYATFFYVEGYLPFKGVITPDSGSGEEFGPFTIPFSKKDLCYAPIQSFTITNNAVAHEPLQILVDARLAADVASAFRLSEAHPQLIPPEMTSEKRDHFSADTRITLRITDASNTIYTITQEKSILASDTETFDFIFTPQVQGVLHVEMISSVIDTQCSAQKDITAQAEVSVLENLQGAFYYSLLQDVIIPPYPVANQEFIIAFNVLSNYNNNNNLETVPTRLTYTFFGEGNTIIKTGGKIIPRGANPTTFIQEEIATSFPEGTYELEIVATPTGVSLPIPVHPSTFRMTFVVEQPRFDFTAKIIDSFSGNALENVRVQLKDAVLYTGSTGEVTFKHIQEGLKQVTISKEGYHPLQDVINLTEDISKIYQLERIPIVVPPVNVTHNVTIQTINQQTVQSISGAEVTIQGVTKTTNTNGNALFENLPSGNYTVLVSKQGFEQKQVVIEVNQNALFIIALTKSTGPQPGFKDLFAVPVIVRNFDNAPTIICHDNFAIGYNETILVPIEVYLNGNLVVNQTSVFFKEDGFRACLNLGILPQGNYDIRFVIDPNNQFEDSDRTNNILRYTITVESSTIIIPPITPETPPQRTLDLQRVGITAFNFDEIDFHKATDLEKIQIGLTNDGDVSFRNVVVTLSIPELGTWTRIGPFNLAVGETVYEYFGFDVYDSYEPGFYDLRVSITTSNGHLRARWFEVYLE